MTNRKYPWAALALVPAAALTLSGCWTPPTDIAAPTGNPSLVGATIVVETLKTTTEVQSVNASQRKVVLRRPNGTTVTCKAGPQVVNLNEIQAGDKVKAIVADEFAIFLVKNGPLPSAGAGIVVDEAGKGALPGGMVLETRDITARAITWDPSYRLLTLEYADGHTGTFKIPLHSMLLDVKKGDDVVVRSAESMAVRLEKS